MGGKFHLKLNTGERPIANKYREGKMKRTLKRELKGPEIVSRETIGISKRAGESAFGCEYPMCIESVKASCVLVCLFLMVHFSSVYVNISLDRRKNPCER